MNFYEVVWRVKFDRKILQRAKMARLEILYEASAQEALEQGDHDTFLMHGAVSDFIGGILGTNNWLDISG